ncbi:MAG: hypothetical protein WCW40_06555 [Bacteroidota bacterium]
MTSISHTALFMIALSSAIVFSSCSTLVTRSNGNAPAVKKNGIITPAYRPILPEGWADITSKSKQPQIKMWIINRDYSATMVLRELQADSETQKVLLNEDINLIAGISLRTKIPENNADYRVTRVPAVIDMKRNLSSYTYTEKGLLRRVVVFKKKDVLVELELMQEQASAEFDVLTNDLVTFATTLYER